MLYLPRDFQFKVTETYYADASVRVPEMKYKHEIKHYRGERLEKTDVTEHTYGEIRTYENVRHDRVRASVRCPYCLQVYEEILAGVNDDLSNKKLKDIQTFHDMKWHS